MTEEYTGLKATCVTGYLSGISDSDEYTPEERREAAMEICKDAEYVYGAAAWELFADGAISEATWIVTVFDHDDLLGKFRNKYCPDDDPSFCNKYHGVYLMIRRDLWRYMSNIVSTDVDAQLLVAMWKDDQFEFRMYDHSTQTLRRLTDKEQENFANKRTKSLSDNGYLYMVCMPGWSIVTE